MRFECVASRLAAPTLVTTAKRRVAFPALKSGVRSPEKKRVDNEQIRAHVW